MEKRGLVLGVDEGDSRLFRKLDTSKVEVLPAIVSS